MASKSTATLQIKVLNCKDLKPTNFNFFQKLNVFVSVALASDDPHRRPKSQPQKTTTEEEKDGNLEWNRDISFHLEEIRLNDCEHLFVTFTFYSPGNILFDDKLLGDVRVPLKDLVVDRSGVVRFRSYEVRTIDGKPNGVLHFSYRLDLDGMGSEIVNGSGGGLVPRIDGYNAAATDHYMYPNENEREYQLPSARIEYPAIDYGGYGSAHEVGYARPAEVVHTAHNGFPVSGIVHVSHDQQQNLGYYAPPPPNPHMFPPAPPPPGLPPHMMFHHQPHSPSSPHLGSPFHSLHHHHTPPPPPHMDPWGYGGAYDNGSSHGGGDHIRNRGLDNYYPNY